MKTELSAGMTAIVFLILHSISAFGQEVAGPAETELIERIEQLSLATLSFGETVRPAIDRSQFDQNSLLDRLDFDDAEIARFVTEEIAYEPYAGLLRGAHGTLLARAGNALDQSLLLATLLNEAGFDAVIRAGTLSGDDAARLLRLLAPESESSMPPIPWEEPTLDSAQLAFAAALGAGPDAAASPGTSSSLLPADVRRRVEADRDLLLETLEDADIMLGDDDVDAKLLVEAQEYFWVDYWSGATVPWTAVHPAFSRTPAPIIEANETYAGNVPAELTHRLRLELLVQQRFGSELITTPLMAPMEFPSANVAGRSLSLVLAPDTLLRTDPFADGASPAAETRFVVPMINGGLPDQFLGPGAERDAVIGPVSDDNVLTGIGPRFLALLVKKYEGQL